jgi:hypothetical protein
MKLTIMIEQYLISFIHSDKFIFTLLNTSILKEFFQRIYLSVLEEIEQIVNFPYICYTFTKTQKIVCAQYRYANIIFYKYIHKYSMYIRI